MRNCPPGKTLACVRAKVMTHKGNKTKQKSIVENIKMVNDCQKLLRPSLCCPGIIVLKTMNNFFYCKAQKVHMLDSIKSH